VKTREYFPWIETVHSESKDIGSITETPKWDSQFQSIFNRFITQKQQNERKGSILQKAQNFGTGLLKIF
jgi:hypothetical protein